MGRNDLDDRRGTQAQMTSCFLYHRQFQHFRIGVIRYEQFKSRFSPGWRSPLHSLESATFLPARAVILVAYGAASSVHLGETLEPSEAVASAVAANVPRLEESSAQDWVGLIPVLVERERHLLRPVVHPVVELEHEHLDKDDEADESEGAARLR